jgi:hypothetical protein
MEQIEESKAAVRGNTYQPAMGEPYRWRYLLRDVINKVNGIHFLAKEEVFTLGHFYESMLRETRDAAGDSSESYSPRPVVNFMVEAALGRGRGATGLPSTSTEAAQKWYDTKCRKTRHHFPLKLRV